MDRIHKQGSEIDAFLAAKLSNYGEALSKTQAKFDKNVPWWYNDSAHDFCTNQICNKTNIFSATETGSQNQNKNKISHKKLLIRI